MKINFWLLDVNQEESEGILELWIWGIDEKDRRIIIIDQTFHPYFYILPKSSEDIEKIVSHIKEKIKISNVKVESKKYFGRQVQAVKITFDTLENLTSTAKIIMKDLPIEAILHDDIRFSTLYLAEKGLKPCSWNSVEADPKSKPYKPKVDAVYYAKSDFTPLERLDAPCLRSIFFHAIYHNEIGSADPLRDPVLTISTINHQGQKRLFSSEDYDDQKILEEFINYIQKSDPDLIVGFRTNRLDFPYLLKRCNKLGITLGLDRIGGEPHTSVYGHISIAGRINIDLLDIAEDTPEVKNKTLENLAEFLGIENIDSIIKIKETEIHQIWENKEKQTQLIKSCEQKADLVRKISDLTLDFIFQLANLIGIPADYVVSAAVGFRVDWYLIRKALAFNELIPKKAEQPYYPYKGGIVLVPKPGLHENVAVLDFSSLYPNIMIKYNLSPDSLLKEDEKYDGKTFTAPEVGYIFRAEPPGFYKQILTELIEARRDIQNKIKKLSPDDYLYKILDARQRSLKVITNATYGYCGWRGARWYVSEVAEAVAAWGRETIKRTIEVAKDLNLDVIYGDTDSIFVKYDRQKIYELLKIIKRELGLDIRPDVTYTRILFTEAKKRYAGLLPNGKIDIVGLEVARGDWCETAKHIQENVLEIILKEKDPNKAVFFLNDFIKQFKRGITDLEPLVIWKTITKPIGEYAVKAPHVEAAKKMMQKGWNLTLGDKVGYVIVKGLGKLYERAIPYFTAEPDDIDLDYYIENQVMPPALRILEIFNIKKEQFEDLKISKKGLAQFF